ncbi:MAG TPA: hypothetical protein VN229_14850 [Terriglobales bacterium]|nr:hypothetical protein [Terriglobales bacterium]
MGNAVWLFCSVPAWYFSTLLKPFGADTLSAVPALGSLCFIVGTVWGIVKRKAILLIFAPLIVVSQALVVVAGFMRGSVGGGVASFTLDVFLLLQVVAAGYFVWRLKGMRGPASVLAIFTSSYAAFAAFIAGMAFTNNWL